MASFIDAITVAPQRVEKSPRQVETTKLDLCSGLAREEQLDPTKHVSTGCLYCLGFEARVELFKTR